MYAAVADFRTGSLRWFTNQLALTTTQASDTDLTDAITAFSERVDLLTGDHYEPEPSSGTTTLDIDSDGGPHLYVPKRIRSLTSLALRDASGVLTVQDAIIYRVRQSLVAGVRQPGDLDVIELVEGQFVSTGQFATGGVLSTGVSAWPRGAQVIQLTGAFSWPSTPERIKRAVALLVWDHFTNEGSDLRRAIRMNTGDADYELTSRSGLQGVPIRESGTTGIPEVDEILIEFSRTQDTYF